MTPVQRATRAAEGYLALRMPDAAWEELESLEPELRAEPEVLLLRVKIYLAKNRPADAVVIGMGLLSLAPACISARELVAEALERQGKLMEALEVLEGAPPGPKKSARQYLGEARLLELMGRTKGAHDRLAQRIDMDKATRQRKTIEEIWRQKQQREEE